MKEPQGSCESSLCLRGTPHTGRVAEEASFELKISRSAEKVREGASGSRKEPVCFGKERSLVGLSTAPGLGLSRGGWQRPHRAFLATGRVLIFIFRAQEATEGL